MAWHGGQAGNGKTSKWIECCTFIQYSFRSAYRLLPCWRKPMQRSTTLSSQLRLPGLDEPSPAFKPASINTSHGTLLEYTLFLAIFPEFTDARQFMGLASELRGQYRLLGKLL